ncbi:MAG: rod shape-determining protein RodA [Acidobacteriota bacterium]
MRQTLRQSLLFGDQVTLFLYLALLAFGTVMVRSATFATKYGALGDRQVVYALLAAAVFALALLVPYQIWVDYGYLLYAAALAALVLVLVLGRTVAGSKSWLYLGPFGFQPSEFAKVAVALACANAIKDLPDKAIEGRQVAFLWGIIALPAVLTFLQPDFGTATTFLPLAGAALYFSRYPLGRILKWAGMAVLAVLLLFALGWFTFLKPYQKDRILTFVNPAHDPKGAGYQVAQARIAVGSGELTGKGLHSGTQNRLNFLPAPHTDFIFGVVAEETGFVGSVGVLLAFLALLARFLSTLRVARDAEGRFLVLCGFAVILYHLLVNVGMVLGLLPTTGLPLPFLSYGGSFLISMSLFAGLAANVRMRRFVP